MRNEKNLRWTALILILLIIFTGCGAKEAAKVSSGQNPAGLPTEETDESQEKKDKDKVVNPADYPVFVNLKVEEDEKGGTYRRTIQGKVDLDFDGKEEKLYFEGDYIEYVDEAFKLVPGVFKIGNRVIDLHEITTPLEPWVPLEDLEDNGYYDTIFTSMEVIDLDPADDRREILIYKTFFLPEITFYVAEVFHYDKGTFTSLGEMETGYHQTLGETEYTKAADIDQENQTIAMDIDDYYFCNFYRKAIYQMKNGKIKDITLKEMEMYLINEEGEKESIVATAAGTVNLYADPTDKTPIYVIQPEDEITLISCKRDEWVNIQVTGGPTGYLKYIPSPDEEYLYYFADDPDSSAWDVFPELPSWG